MQAVFVRSRPHRDEIKTLADTLLFSTAISMGVNPNVTLVGDSTKFHLTGAGGEALMSRTDNHKLIISISLPKGGMTAIDSAEEELTRQQDRNLADALTTLTDLR